MDWRRLFGLVLTDFFTDWPVIVELEKDLSQQQQFLDVVIIRRGKGRFPGRLPDGLDHLAAHNLVTFKSHREALDDWALMELTGHYVGYRKLLRRARQPLLPAEAFGLYAICSSYPHNLANAVPLERVQEGVYDCRRGTNTIRVIVAGQLPQEAHNAPLHLFSARAERVGYGARHYRRRSPNTSSLLEELFQGYDREGAIMPYTMQDFQKDYVRNHFMDFTPKERHELLRRLPAAELRELLTGLSAQERRELLTGLSPTDSICCRARRSRSTSSRKANATVPGRNDCWEWRGKRGRESN
jgi:hypothetical protein